MNQPESTLRSRVSESWEILAPPSKDLVDARLQLHFAAQLAAASGSTYGVQQSDYSHAALSWDRNRRLLMSTRVPEPKGFQVGLGLVDMALVVFDEHGRKVDETSLDHMSLEEGRSWLEDVLKNRLGRDDAYKLAFQDHEMPIHSVGGGGLLRFKPERAFDELDKLFGDAAEFLSAFAEVTDEAGPVFTWPHHFDTAVLIELDGGSPGETLDESEQRTIGVGFSPGDNGSDEPYWYVTPWPYPQAADLPDTISPGRWNTAGWVGAVLPVSEISRERNATAQVRTLDRFVTAAVGASRALLETEPAR